jgi:ribokinase
VNEHEAAWLAAYLGAASDDAASLHAALGTTIIRTMGGAGVEWFGADIQGYIEASCVEVRDTTAAGDCFVGVLAAALDHGASLPDAVHRANLAAGLACTRAGSQSSLPDATMIAASLMGGTPASL